GRIRRPAPRSARLPDDTPVLGLESLPEVPREGFLTWFEGAVASGVRQPHALIFQTGAGDDTPVGRPGSSRTSTSTVSTSSPYLPQGSADRAEPAGEIGRASCRERAY